jgi:hypothetical protein
MPLPTQLDVQAVDPVLTNLLVGYMQAESRFVAGRVFPPVLVDKKSGTYYIFTKKYWFLDEMKQRAPGETFRRGGYGVESTTFKTLIWGLEHPIADETRDDSQVPMSLEEAGLRWLSTQSLIRKERAFSADFMVVSVWGTDDNNSATDWDDFASGDPAANVKTAQRTILTNTGQVPNTMVVGRIVDDALTLHPDILDRIKYTQAATDAAIRGALAAALGLQNYLVGEAVYNSANEGQTMTGAAIIDDDALICYCAGAPGILTPSCGYSFSWPGGGGQGAIVPYRDQSAKSDILQHSEAWDQKVVASDLGYIFLGIV